MCVDACVCVRGGGRDKRRGACAEGFAAVEGAAACSTRKPRTSSPPPLAVPGADDDANVVGKESGHPESHETFVQVERLQRPLCGGSRPHFFRGVATVRRVLKLSGPKP